MTTSLVVVAHRTGARFLTHDGRGEPLEQVEELHHPRGRAQNHDVETDRPGRTFDRVGPGRHAKAKEEPAHERAAANFARQVAHTVEDLRNRNAFQNLVLVAEPRFLGMLREALSDEATKRIRGEVRKDLARTPIRELGRHLSDVLRVG